MKVKWIPRLSRPLAGLSHNESAVTVRISETCKALRSARTYRVRPAERPPPARTGQRTRPAVHDPTRGRTRVENAGAADAMDRERPAARYSSRATRHRSDGAVLVRAQLRYRRGRFPDPLPCASARSGGGLAN